VFKNYSQYSKVSTNYLYKAQS